MHGNTIFSTQGSPSLKANHYSPQPSASVNNVIYSTRFARGVNRITTHFFVLQHYITVCKTYFTLNKVVLEVHIMYLELRVKYHIKEVHILKMYFSYMYKIMKYRKSTFSAILQYAKHISL